MSPTVYPHSRLLIGPLRTIVISGPHIQVVDTTTGNTLFSTSKFEDKEKDAVIKSGPIRCATLSSSGALLASAGDDKILKVWEIPGLVLLNERELPKKPTGILFSSDNQTLIVSDKFGDVFSYPLHPTVASVKIKRDALSSHENPSNGRLILGHASLLTAALLTADEQYIITADRDEHIRVSWYPQGYNIERYCLGHEKFVSAIHIPAFDASALISGGGDPTLRIWDWMSGRPVHEVPILDAVAPFIRVKAVRRRNDDTPGEFRGRRNRAKAKRARKEQDEKAKEGKAAVSNADDTNAAAAILVEDGEASTSADKSQIYPDEESATPTEKGETVLVVHKIDTLLSEDARYIVFSTVGATALFFCPYPQDHVYPLQKLDFEKPVLDFTIAADGLIWVTLDVEYTENGAEPAEPKKFVRIVRLSQGALTEIDASSAPPLLTTLNSAAILPATAADIKVLDAYLPLIAMPKNAEVDQDPMERDLSAVELPGEDSRAATPQGKQISKKELGRLKNKQKLLAKMQASGSGAAETVGEDEPSAKKTKSEQGDEDAAEDDQMDDS